MTRRNVLLIVSDEERRNGRLDGRVDLPAHERLRRDGMSFDGYFTHSSPCSPARASPYTGREMDARASSGRRSAMGSHSRARQPARHDVVPQRPAGHAAGLAPRPQHRALRRVDLRRRSPDVAAPLDEASLHERLAESPTYMSTNYYRAVAAGHPAR
jgi:hypothetical protein